LLDTNVGVYRSMIPQIVAAAPDAVLLVVTDPPDPLADLTRELSGHDRVLSTGTFLDSLRFRTHLAERLHVSARSVDALVLGEHGTSEVFLWSTARVGGAPVEAALPQGMSFTQFRADVERDVRYANITIIEGNDASQFGIGIVSTRITEAILRDERAVLPVGVFNPKYGATITLPCVVGQGGAGQVLEPAMSADERTAFEHSA
jgi:L-lactate dehydrogenase